MAKIKFDKFNEKPTPKQIKFAQAISDTLDYELPTKQTKEEYSKFISEHILEYEQFWSETDNDFGYWCEQFGD